MAQGKAKRDPFFSYSNCSQRIKFSGNGKSFTWKTEENGRMDVGMLCHGKCLLHRIYVRRISTKYDAMHNRVCVLGWCTLIYIHSFCLAPEILILLDISQDKVCRIIVNCDALSNIVTKVSLPGRGEILKLKMWKLLEILKLKFHQLRRPRSGENVGLEMHISLCPAHKLPLIPSKWVRTAENSISSMWIPYSSVCKQTGMQFIKFRAFYLVPRYWGREDKTLCHYILSQCGVLAGFCPASRQRSIANILASFALPK